MAPSRVDGLNELKTSQISYKRAVFWLIHKPDSSNAPRKRWQVSHVTQSARQDAQGNIIELRKVKRVSWMSSFLWPAIDQAAG